MTYQNLEDGPFSDTIQGAIQWKDIATCVSSFLESVKSELLSQSKAFVPELAETCSQALSCQGKLLRPTVFALTASSIGKLNKKCITVATVIEMIHLASLLHDDVIDGADIRRKQPTFAHLCGNRTAILLGDCILSQAAYLAASLDNEQVTQKILSSARSICIGETLQSLHTLDIHTHEQYFKVISLKT
ncbi:MAG: polyprenyl synthetase family protein [Verrucomicrobia bacterium]|nr:polyprenyl synthetase family protein [Verrucomicrobiota bacterium]